MQAASIAMPCPRVSVIVPTLNEARNLPHVFARIPADLHEVIVVDGHSADDTLAVARGLRPDVRTVIQARKGKGNALACGFAAVRPVPPPDGIAAAELSLEDQAA